MTISAQIGLPTHIDIIKGTEDSLGVWVLDPKTDEPSDLTGATTVTFYMRADGASANIIDGVTSGATLAAANPAKLEFDWTSYPTSGFDVGIYHATFFYTLSGIVKPVTAVTLWFKEWPEVLTGGK